MGKIPFESENTMILEIHVCDTFAEEYEKAIANEGYSDVVIKKYPCFCCTKGSKIDTTQQQLVEKNDADTIIIGSSQCRFLKNEKDKSFIYSTQSSSYCFSHLTSDSFIKSIIENGGTIVTSGWLKNWRVRLEQEKFTREIAQRFYSEFCNQIVLLDTGVDDSALEHLIEFSKFIDIPYKRIYIGLDELKIFIRSIVYEWKLNRKKQDLNEMLKDKQRQVAEYSAVLNIIEKIADNTKKREVINTLIEMFHNLFGATKVRYIEDLPNREAIEEGYKSFFDNANLEYLISEEKNSLVIKIQQNKELFGIIEASDFLFPKYIKAYTNFAVSISRVGALVFSNVKQYEALEKVKDDITYTSYHDSLTGLYNRNYYTEYLLKNECSEQTILYMCDIDGLKKVNDTFGHSYGDELIRMAGAVLSHSVRETDTIARIGGDEFVIIQTSEDLEIAKKTKKRIEEAIKQKNSDTQDKFPFSLSLSVGVAKNDNGDKTWRELEETADQEMYEEKMMKRRNL